MDNAYDAAQRSSMDQPVEAASIVAHSIARTGNFVEDVMTQYAQSRPWILLEEGGGNTVSQRHAAEAQQACSTTRAAMRPRR